MGYRMGYIFENEPAAQAAVDAINAHYGLPIPDGVTTDWTNYVPWGDAFAIMYDESIEAVLGAPVVLPELPYTDGLDN